MDELFLALTDFPQLLDRSIEEQQTLVDRVTPAVENPDGELSLDGTDTAWRQRFVEDWAQMLQVKATTSLPRLEQMLASGPAADSGGAASPPDEPDPQAAAFRKMGALKESMEKAVEVCPQVATLTGEAADLLENRKPGEALPKQEEALKLLQEITEPIRKQQEEEQKEREEQQQNEDQQPEDQPQDEPDQDQENQEREEQQRQGSRQDEKRRQMSQKQIQALLENMRERKRKRDEALKQLRAVMGGRSKVDKDW